LVVTSAGLSFHLLNQLTLIVRHDFLPIRHP
jgi:hypothetical protein